MTLLALGAPGGRTAWTVQDGGRSFAVFLVGERCYVTDAKCPHNGGPLDQGWIRHDRVLTCPWHWYRFDLGTGRSLNPGGYQLGCYRVVERDGELYAEVPEAAPARGWAQILRAHARGEDS